LDFFKGAIELLSRPPRPVILCELEDIRTKPWGYSVKDVEAYLQNLGYTWYRPLVDGSLEPVRRTEDLHGRNFVAAPPERMDSIKETITNGTCSKVESFYRG
jgi:hypothetical protein